MIMLIKMTHRQFQSRLLKVQGCKFVGLTAITDPEMRVRKNPYKNRVIKVCRVNACINWRYAPAVNRQRIREAKPADFKAELRKWGARVERCPLVIHVEDDLPRLYLEVKVEGFSAKYFDTITDEEIPFEKLAPYFPKRRPTRQKLEKTVVLKDYRLDHIAELRIDKEVWRIEPLWWRMQLLHSETAKV